MDNPELYNENNQLQEFGVEKFFNFHSEYLRKEYERTEMTLLDIGSGCGRVLTEVVVGKSELKFSKIIGIDISKEMVKFSNEKYGSDLMSFQVMDAEGEVPESLKNQQFDMVTSFFCLPYCKDINAAFQNIHNFLKPNGIFCCIFSQLSKAAKDSQLVGTDDKHAKFMIKYRDIPNSRLMDDPSEVIRRHLNENRMEVVELIDIKNDEFEFADAEAAKRKSLLFYTVFTFSFI